jgi:hypothetical protein
VLDSGRRGAPAGAVEEHATLTPLNVLPWSVTLPDVGPNVGLEPGSSRSLAPGSYLSSRE